MKICHVIHMKFNQFNHMITNLPTKRILSDRRVTNISKSFTHDMAAKNGGHRYGTKLRHGHGHSV